MDWAIVWTEPATADLEAITTYIARRDPSAAERIANAIVGRVESLRAMPSMGSVYPPGSQGRNREILSGKYRIFYRVNEEAKQVEVLTVWHGARREPPLPD
jgi:toxin ParE1/3/4